MAGAWLRPRMPGLAARWLPRPEHRQTHSSPPPAAAAPSISACTAGATYCHYCARHGPLTCLLSGSPCTITQTVRSPGRASPPAARCTRAFSRRGAALRERRRPPCARLTLAPNFPALVQVGGHALTVTVERCSSYVERSSEVTGPSSCPAKLKLNQNFDAADYQWASTEPTLPPDRRCGKASPWQAGRLRVALAAVDQEHRVACRCTRAALQLLSTLANLSLPLVPPCADLFAKACELALPGVGRNLLRCSALHACPPLLASPG